MKSVANIRPDPRRKCAIRRRRGISIAWLLISLGLVTTLTGVTLDTAHLFLSTQQVQNAADAAALAAARLVRSDTAMARSVAIVTAQANTVAGTTVVLEDNPENDPTGDIVMGIYNRVVGVNVVNAQPGYYPNGIRVGASGTLNMAPGIYIVGKGNGGGQFPPGFRVDGAGRVNGSGVMIYVLDGAIDLAGSGAINISPPDSSVHNFPGVETYEGISIFQARNNTIRSRIVGAAQMNLQGTVYMPNNELDLRGSGSGIGNQLIVKQLLMSGAPNVTVNYNGAFPTGTSAIFIVR